MNFKKILEELPAGVAVLDEELRLIFVNKRIIDKSGVTAEIADPLDTVHPEDKKFALEVFRKFLEGKRSEVPYPVLLRVVRKGGYQWNEIRWKVVEEEGKIYYALVFTDVTERVLLQKRLEKLLDYMRFLNSIMRHDLSNILTAVDYYTEMLEEEFNQSSLEKLKSSVLRGLDLIKKIRELESSMEEKIKLYSLRRVLEESARGYEIEINIQGDAYVYANEGIYSVFDNLIGNSVKHGKAKRIEVEIKTSDRVYLSFKDDGVGIPEIFREKIFDKGFSTTGSTGLGLYIVKKLLEGYGGSIKLEDSDKGAKFLLSFPLPENSS
ncbi:MAG: PAS domain-containing sensor histidine kinase [Archaeoglobaceae archaeon]|nr:PAS domain-containing sensor histidine kinase [Archaeoglobaceae archaeon]MDW8128432.1 ATP-binding protein [Archaeoglobaceae archaeon]